MRALSSGSLAAMKLIDSPSETLSGTPIKCVLLWIALVTVSLCSCKYWLRHSPPFFLFPSRLESLSLNLNLFWGSLEARDESKAFLSLNLKCSRSHSWTQCPGHLGRLTCWATPSFVGLRLSESLPDARLVLYCWVTAQPAGNKQLKGQKQPPSWQFLRT